MYYTNRYNCATREHIVAYSLLFWHTPHFSLRRIHNPQAHLIAYYKCVYEAKISASCERFNALYASRPSAGEPEPTGQSANARLLTSARNRAPPTIVTSQIDHNLLRLGFMPGGFALSACVTVRSLHWWMLFRMLFRELAASRKAIYESQNMSQSSER